MIVAPFSVWEFFAGGECSTRHTQLDAWTAVAVANRLTQSLAARIGTTCRIVILDAHEYPVWEWRYGKGVSFPALERRQGEGLVITPEHQSDA